MKYLHFVVGALLLTLLSGCVPPIFINIIGVDYVLVEENYTISVDIVNNPMLVTCSLSNGQSLELNNTEGNTWEGIAKSGTHLEKTESVVDVSCTAKNQFGQISTPVGRINVVPNKKPVIALVQNNDGKPGVLICDYEPDTLIYQPIVDFRLSRYIKGAKFELTGNIFIGDPGLFLLPTGYLFGVPQSGNEFSATDLYLAGITLGGSTTVGPFSFVITEAPCDEVLIFNEGRFDVNRLQ